MTEKKKKKEEEEKDETSELLNEEQGGAVTESKGTDIVNADLGKRAPGTESIEAGDTIFPRFRLLQKSSQEVENNEEEAGVFKNSITEEIHKTLILIPLALLKTRIMFDEDNVKGPPICMSLDMVHGSGCECGCNSICADCKNQKWQGGPPKCSLVYNYPSIFPEDVGKKALPTLLSLSKSSTNSAQKINTIVENNIPSIPFWYHVWEFTTVSRPFKKGSAFIIKAKQVRETTKEERSWCEKVYHGLIAGKQTQQMIDVNENVE